jgi:hypothetical protein
MSHLQGDDFGEAMNSREAEIHKRLRSLHEQLETFSYPIPADVAAGYEIERLESWARSREQIRTLEKELAEIHRSAIPKSGDCQTSMTPGDLEISWRRRPRG